MRPNNNKINDNNSHNGHDMKMMWLMMIFCALPLLWSVLVSKNFSLRANGGGLIIVAVMLVSHFWLMKKMHHNKPVLQKISVDDKLDQE